MRPVRSFLAIAVITFAPLAYAHENAPAGPNGGEVRDAGKYHLELVAKDAKLALYVTDTQDRKVSTKGAAASATVLSGKERATVKLEPAGENVLSGAAKPQPGSDMKVVVSLTLAGEQSVQARFTPLAVAKPEAKAAGSVRK